MQNETHQYDILCVGELLVDMMSEELADNFSKVENFKRIQGGSPANLAMNMKRLGNKVCLVASVGQDDMGNYLVQSVEEVGLEITSIARVEQPSTMILVTRSKSVSNFEAYRGADCQISEMQLNDELLKSARIFHTTCFGLSQLPAQENIMNAALKAHQNGAQLSIDLNYAAKIWKDQKAAQKIVEAYCSYGAIVKVSEVDWGRLYNQQLIDYELVGQHFLNLEAKVVCLTLGEKGVWVFSKEETHFLPSRSVEVKDTTGAGDAFWSGFLTAHLDGKDLLTCAKAGRSMAEFKIQRFGSLPKKVERSLIYS
ncbi:MAG: PfkB family carbohydrate kinase [Bacteroidota bacterium]